MAGTVLMLVGDLVQILGQIYVLSLIYFQLLAVPQPLLGGLLHHSSAAVYVFGFVLRACAVFA